MCDKNICDCPPLKVGEYYLLQNGLKAFVSFIHSDEVNTAVPVVGYYYGKDGIKYSMHWSRHGTSPSGAYNVKEVWKEPLSRTLWINVYFTGEPVFHETRPSALNNLRKRDSFGTYRVEITEGQEPRIYKEGA